MAAYLELREQCRKRIEEQEILKSLEAFKSAIGESLNYLGFEERRQLVRLLVEGVEVAGNDVRIKHIIPIIPGVHLNLSSHNFSGRLAIPKLTLCLTFTRAMT